MAEGSKLGILSAIKGKLSRNKMVVIAGLTAVVILAALEAFTGVPVFSRLLKATLGGFNGG